MRAAQGSPFLNIAPKDSSGWTSSLATTARCIFSRGFPPTFPRTMFLSLFALLLGCTEIPVVSTAPVARSTVESVVTSVNSGTVRAEQQAELAFGAVGRVNALAVKLGDSVPAGTVLAELENADLKSALVYLQREAQRRKELASKKLISASEFEDIERQVTAAASALEKTVIRAPFDGIITELNLEVGQLSQITAVVPKPLIRLIDTAPRYIRAEIDEVDLSKVRVGSEARVKILTIGRTPLPATVRRVIPFISTIREQDRTAEIELDVHTGSRGEAQMLPVGASADVEVVVERRSNVLTVPSKSVFGRSGARAVFQLKDGRAVRTTVETGIAGFDATEIVSGLPEGAIVIIPSEAVQISDGLRVTQAAGVQ